MTDTTKNAAGFVTANLGVEQDVTVENWREYVFPNNQRIRIYEPKTLWVKVKPGGDSHRLVTVNDVSWYIPAGWLAINWQAKNSAKPVSF